MSICRSISRFASLMIGCVACSGSPALDGSVDTTTDTDAGGGHGDDATTGKFGATDAGGATGTPDADGRVGTAEGGAVDGGAASGSEGGETGGTMDGGPSAPDGFVLSWEDEFDTLDTSAWQLETFTYAGNEALFSTQNASVAGGILTIELTPNPSSATTPYLGVEMRSVKALTYGKVSASMRFAHGSGVVSGLVLFYTPFPNCNWNEIDIEHLGDSSNTSQLNSQVFTGTPMPQCATSVTPTQDPLIVDLGVNAETAFHQYDIEWTPAGVTTKIDGATLRTWTKAIALMTLPQNILLTIWASSAASWAGPLQPSSAPTSADIDWIKVYDWAP